MGLLCQNQQQYNTFIMERGVMELLRISCNPIAKVLFVHTTEQMKACFITGKHNNVMWMILQDSLRRRTLVSIVTFSKFLHKHRFVRMDCTSKNKIIYRLWSKIFIAAASLQVNHCGDLIMPVSLLQYSVVSPYWAACQEALFSNPSLFFNISTHNQLVFLSGALAFLANRNVYEIITEVWHTPFSKWRYLCMRLLIF